MERRDDEGDAIELARFVFDERSAPGPVVLDLETAISTVPERFRFLCDLYITGAKLYNGLAPTDDFADLLLARKSTHAFLAKRMHAALSVVPTLEPLEPAAPHDGRMRYRFTTDADALERNSLEDLKLNTKLSMRYAH